MSARLARMWPEGLVADGIAMIAAWRDAYGDGWEGDFSRKLRLLCCACCFALRGVVTDPRSRAAVRAGLLEADGVPEAGLRHAAGEARAAISDDSRRDDTCAVWAAWAAARCALARIDFDAVQTLMLEALYAGLDPLRQAGIVREVVGPIADGGVLFSLRRDGRHRLAGVPVRDRPPVPGWLTPEAASLGEAAYGEMSESGELSGDRLAVLADCLEEAGCDDLSILRHLRGRRACRRCDGTGHGGDNFVEKGLKITCVCCRNSGEEPLRAPHYRGCWALDCVLGKPKSRPGDGGNVVPL